MPGTQSKISDPYHLFLGIPPDHQPPTLYRLLGLEPFEKNPDVIDAAASRQSLYLHQIAAGPNRQEVQKLLTEIAGARRYLLNPQSKKEYDAKLRDESHPYVNLVQDLPPIESNLNLANIPLAELMGEPPPPPIWNQSQYGAKNKNRVLRSVVIASTSIVSVIVLFYVASFVISLIARATSGEGPEWIGQLALLDDFAELPGAEFETKVTDAAQIVECREGKLWTLQHNATQSRAAKWTFNGVTLRPGYAVSLDFFLDDNTDNSQAVGIMIDDKAVRVFRDANRKLAVDAQDGKIKWPLPQDKITTRGTLVVMRGAGPMADKLTWWLLDEKIDVAGDFVVKDLVKDPTVGIQINVGGPKSALGSWIDNLRHGRLGKTPAIKDWVKN